MKGSHPQITMLGNNSGRNLGDAAIMSAILHSLTDLLPDAEFYVPSINPEFIDDNYSQSFNVRGVDVSPKTLSMRLLGLPTLRSLAKSDIALICDGIIFGRKLFSPHNFLITLVFVVPIARLLGCKVVCYSCGIGPFPTKLSEKFAKWVINLCDLVIMRENDSKALAQAIGITKDIQVTGDAAFLNYISDSSRAVEIAKGKGIDPSRRIIGLNVTPYLDSWLEQSERLRQTGGFIRSIADAVNLALKEIAERNPADVPQCVLFSCSPMDEKFSAELASMVDGVVIDNTEFLSHDIQAVMKLCGLLVGMRFHSLILSSAVGVPIVGLVYAPKVRGYMRLLGCPEYGIELRDITPESLGSQIASAWGARAALRHKQQAVVTELADGAQNAAREVARKYFDVVEVPTSAVRNVAN